MDYKIPIKKVTIGNKTLFTDTELAIKERGITVIVGSNGCGKTTLLNQILYMHPESVLLIAQENDLIFHNKTVEENIILFNGDAGYLHELLRNIDMEYVLTRKPSQLSGGEKRIVSLLRLFFVERNIVILDEPTNDLDYRCVETVKKILCSLSAEKSILIVTHDDRIIQLADRKYQFSNEAICTNYTGDESVQPLPRAKSNENVQRVMKVDVIGIVLFLVIVFSVFCSELSYFLFMPEKVDTITENQTNLATRHYGSTQAMVEKGYLPIALYLSYNGSLDVEFLKRYSEKLQESMMRNQSNNMYIEDDYGESVYLGVAWNPSSDLIIYPLRDYQSLYSAMNDGKKLNLSDYLTVSDGVTEIAQLYTDGIAEKIDDTLYHTLVDVYFSEYPQLQPRLYIIIGENREKMAVANEGWFVKNNVTIDICNRINALVNLRDFLITTLFCLAGSIGVFVLYFFINLKLLRKQIIVLRNFGIPSDTLLSELYKVRGASKEKALILCPFLLINMVLLFTGTEKVIFGLAVLLGISVYVSMILISRKLLKKTVSTIYSFGGLYENRR